MDDPRFNPILEATKNFIKSDIQQKLPDFIEGIALGYLKDPDEAQEVIDEILEKFQDILPGIL